jgi:hypothetical protein
MLDKAIKIVDFIMARPLNSSLVKLHCSDMGSEYESMNFHTEVRWLSRGKVLMTAFQLNFLFEKETLANYLSDVS